MSVRQAADLLGVSFWTLYGWVRLGGVPSYKLGRRRLVAMEDLQALLRRSRHERRADAEGGKQ